MGAEAHRIEQAIDGSTDPIVLEFHANDCQPCVTQDDFLTYAAARPDFSANVLHINIDDTPQIAARYDVVTVPSVIVLKGDAVCAKYTGLIDPGSVVAAIEAARI